MTYSIQYFYETGDSFGTCSSSDRLELTWENKALAIKALKDIKEHYQAYRDNHTYARRPKPLSEEIRSKEWFVPDKYSPDQLNSALRIKSDNGEYFQFHAPWCGYFERLLSADVVLTPEMEETHIEFNC